MSSKHLLFMEIVSFFLGILLAFASKEILSLITLLFIVLFLALFLLFGEIRFLRNKIHELERKG